MTDEILLKAFKEALYYDDCNRIMEGGVSVPLIDSEYFQAFKCGFEFSEAQKAEHNN